MGKTSRHLLIFLSALMAMPSCDRTGDPEERRLSWSTESPLSIPFRVRQQRFTRGNLLRNPSFETGKTLKVDSTQRSAVIDGWHQAGPHVDWVDIEADSLYDRDEAFSGRRSIRIIRTHADETEKQGEGILSEYIRVIPGNYSLSFYARMKEVRPVKGRLGMRMFDAVNVQLQFFDKNKIALDPGRAYPPEGAKIDNSFKALSLANFTTIPEFRWGKIIGKSAGFPFPDGDIPTDAHYVKIFIGLKGTGTLWIDSVSFTYTRHNFSAGERMTAYTDTMQLNQPAVIPNPKSMSRLESVAYSTTGKPDEIPVILIPENADPLIRQSAVALQKALSTHAGSRPVPILTGQAGAHKSKLTFVLGEVSSYAAYTEKLPLDDIRSHPQGYIIETLPALPGVVFLNGNNPVGLYYAVMTAIQLIDRKMPVFHNARVIDFPDFENRFVTVSNLTGKAGSDDPGVPESLAALKLNGAFSRVQSVENGWSKALFTTRALPVWPAEPVDSTLGYTWPVQAGTAAVAVKGASTGASRLPNFIIPGLFHNQLLDYAMADHPAEDGPADLPFLYAGSTWFSMNTDAADFERFTKHLSARPVFMDNSMQAATQEGRYGGAMPWYPGKLRLFNLFEPFGNTGIRDCFDRIDHALYWTNLDAGSGVNLIRLATAADFMWNSTAYDPDLSLWRVLCSRFGAENARILLEYADRYGLLLETRQKLLKKEPLPRSLKNLRAEVEKFNALCGKLEEHMGPSHPLVLELLDLEGALKADLLPYIEAAP